MPLQNIHEIVYRCMIGETAAFRLLMDEYQDYAYAVAFRIVSNEEDARDIVQESFIRVWKNLDRYTPTIKFTTWLYTIVTNLCVDALRARKRRPNVSAEDTDVQAVASTCHEGDPERLYADKEFASKIGMLIESLPTKQKIIFVLRDLQELSIREVCDILGLSESSVKTNLVYARRYLRQELERDESFSGERHDM